jgi:peptide/nickel transport system substrate-binding protein
MIKSKVIVIMMIAFCLVFLVANVSKASSDILVVTQPRDVTALDYGLVAQTEAQTLSNNIFDTLVRINQNYEYVPWLAESWENPDNNTWIFHLRKDIYFTNGEVLDAHAVKYSLERIMNPETNSPQAWRLNLVKEIETPDDYTVVIKTKEPYAALLNIMTLMFIVPPEYVEKVGNTEFGANPIGSGPYKVDEFSPGSKVVLVANEDYWKGAPEVKKIIVRPISEPSTRIAALLSGEVDIVSSVPPNRLEELKKRQNIELSAKNGIMLYMGLDTYNPPFDNLKVRQALNYAIDVKTICDTVLVGTAQPMAGPVFRVTKGFDKNIKPYSYDIDKARKLLEEAGYEDGFEMTLSFPPEGVEGTTNVLEVAQIIAAQLSQLGIDVKLDLTDPATQFTRYKNREFQAYLFTWDTQIEPDRYLYSLFDSDARGYYYKNTEVDSLLRKGRSTMDQAQRKIIYEKIHRVLYEDAPWVFLYNQLGYYAFKSNIDFEAPADGMMFFYDVDVH